MKMKNIFKSYENFTFNQHNFIQHFNHDKPFLS
jgi:hypothetical protein